MAAKYVTEFIGTFFLVLTIGLTVTQGVAMAPLAIGCSLMIMVYMGGHISGGHYNPAVTLAATLRGASTIADLIPYWISQVLGSLAAAVIVSLVIPTTETTSGYFGPAPGEGYTLTSMGPWIVEILFTFALCLVVLNVATSVGTKGNSFYGLAIGFTVLSGAYAVGGISGGVFNPAVAVGISILGLSSWANIWVYMVANLAGGAAAASVFMFVNGTEE